MAQQYFSALISLHTGHFER